MVVLKGWRYVAFLGVVVGGIAAVVYPVAVDPMLNSDKYKNIQKITRAGVRQEDIQPGNMKVWSDPFGRK